MSFSVVIPAFDAVDTIEAAISSAFAQTVPPEEVIVVDDGSTDGTLQAVRSMDAGVTILRQERQGPSVARQAGTEAASTDYVAYLDADDWWPPDKLESCSSALASGEIHFMIADLRRAPPGVGPETYSVPNTTFFAWFPKFLAAHSRRVGDDLYRFEPEDALRLLLKGFPVFPSTAIARRSVVLEAGGWDPRFWRCQDFDLGLRICREHPLHFMSQVHAIVGLHEGNEDGRSYVMKQLKGDITVLTAHWEGASDSPYRKKVARALAQKLCLQGYTYRQAGEVALARQSYRQALRWPGRRMHALLRLAML